MIRRYAGLLMTAWMTMSATADAVPTLDQLKPAQQISDFSTEALYENQNGLVMGARFRHVPTGFVLDFLRIQSVPQAFMWVNSFPPSDQGEPHTCEHLLLGKGTRGRYVASLEDMSLGSSSAFTMQLQTCYHFHTASGTDVFFDLMQAKLEAMLHPTYSDEEIRREVCNMGYRIDPEDSSIELEEKGTVYNEMVSSFERPWANLGRELDLLLFGPDHPLSYSSGGIPDHIRTMTPDDLRAFHAENYRLGNMGMIMSLPDDIDLVTSLARISEIFAAVQPGVELDQDPAAFADRLPPPRSAGKGEIRVTQFPHQNENEPGLLVYAWPPTLNLTAEDEYLLEVFFELLADGQGSDLYRMFIDSETRVMDLGANSVFTWIGSEPGHPVYLGFSNVKRDVIDADDIAEIRRLMLDRIKEIASWPSGDPDLVEFNERAKSRVLEGRRRLSKFLNSPPGFGFRGTGSEWFYHMQHLQKVEGFHKRLSLDDEFARLEQRLADGQNFWADYIRAWNLTKNRPYAVGTHADPDIIERSEAAREERIAEFTSALATRASTTDPLKAYREQYDRRTAEIEAEAATIEMPGFVDHPPLSLDDPLSYRQDDLAGVPAVFSTFENITSGTVGVAFGLHALKPGQLVYLPALPTLLTDVGVVDRGVPVPYDEMSEAIRREILSLSAYFTVNYRTRRAELVVKAAGSNEAESERAVEWLDLVLQTPDWREDNLPRIRDVVDLRLKSRRNTMSRREEAWVQDPARAWWKQTDAVLLSADCFLTQTHALHRLRWLLKSPLPLSARAEFDAFGMALIDAAQSAAPEDLADRLGELTERSEGGRASAELLEAWDRLPESARTTAGDMVSDLLLALSELPSDVPDEDIAYLVRQMQTDLDVPPTTVLVELESVRQALLHRDNARAFVIASTPTEARLTPGLTRLLTALDEAPSPRPRQSTEPVVLSRLRARGAAETQPAFVGLVNPNTRSGVFINTTDCASFESTDTEALLNFLSARLYGGGGAHSMFMKTWGAGLAYSNGLRSNENNGRLIYYAERCPDLAQTMQFVVGELKGAPYDTSLAAYAVAQAFATYRAGRGYEERGEAMASDLADGLTPDRVMEFRRGILALRDREDLYDQLYARMPSVYGEVLPGYGRSSAESPGAQYFVIGPETQISSWENYVRSVDRPDAHVVRLYPRDFWIVGPEAH